MASIQYANENEILVKYDDPVKAYVEEVMPAKVETKFRIFAKTRLSFRPYPHYENDRKDFILTLSPH